MTHAEEIERGERFQFGENWSRFLALLSEERIEQAERSLREMLGIPLEGIRFLDVGSGSGLFSLAARRLGATVHSFDYDPQSVACTRELRRRYFPDDDGWIVEEGSVLDEPYLAGLGDFDVVYSWGVLHHTGHMWQALENVHGLVRPGGLLFIALYNDMGNESVRWRGIKKRYCSLPRLLRTPYALWAMLPYELKDVGRAVLSGRPGDYVRSWTEYDGQRGMSRWRDIVDWVGGYPYEVAGTEDVVRYFGERGFAPVRVEGTRGLGCNEFVLRREPAPVSSSG